MTKTKAGSFALIVVFKSNNQDKLFYSWMGEYFASLEIGKELERQVYNKPNTDWYLSIREGSVAGFASVCDCGKHYFLDNLFVLPCFRNSGIAKEIVGYIVKDFTEKPIRCIANNPYALKIFSSFGFVEDGHNGKYKKLIKH